jgi:hypothetical protein
MMVKTRRAHDTGVVAGDVGDDEGGGTRRSTSASGCVVVNVLVWRKGLWNNNNTNEDECV